MTGKTGGRNQKPETDWAKYVTAAEAAEQLGMNGRVLRRQCEQGRVPYARRRSHDQWMLPAKAVKFLMDFDAKHPRATGIAGQEAAAKQRKLAARRDPSCLALQRAWDKKHPPGSYPDRKLASLWRVTDRKADRLYRLAQFCKLLQEQAGDAAFVLSLHNMKRIAGFDAESAAIALAALVGQKIIARQASGRFRYIGG